MIELIARGVLIQGVADHPWVLAIVAVFAAMWVAGRRIQVREEAAALRAKRQEAVVLFGRLRDHRATQDGRTGLH